MDEVCEPGRRRHLPFLVFAFSQHNTIANELLEFGSSGMCQCNITLRVRVLKNHILAQSLYQYYQIPKYQNHWAIGPLGSYTLLVSEGALCWRFRVPKRNTEHLPEEVENTLAQTLLTWRVRKIVDIDVGFLRVISILAKTYQVRNRDICPGFSRLPNWEISASCLLTTLNPKS